MSEWIDAMACARKLKHPLGWFYKNRARLEANGFPLPDPRVVGHPRWRAAEVDAYVDGEQQRTSIGDVAISDDTIASELDENARAIARGMKGESADA